MANIRNLQLFLLSLSLTLCFHFQGFALETDTISSLQDPDYIVSPRRVFKLGFFSPENTTNRYLAIFYVVSERDTVWVANRGRPLADSSGRVTISADGNLVLKNGRNDTLWSTNAENTPNNVTAQLEDTGNLVLRDTRTGKVTWESFAHPTDVFLPGMKLIDNTNTGDKLVLSSWKNGSDPDAGNFTLGIGGVHIPHIFGWRNGRIHWRNGPWNGQFFTGSLNTYSISMAQYMLTLTNESGILSLTNSGTGFLMKSTLNTSGISVQTLWDDQKKSWDTIWNYPQSECDFYGKCGPFGTCYAQNSPVCSCLRGFEPLNDEEWRNGNWTRGCVRKTKLQCDRVRNTSSAGGKEDGFFRMQYVKLPDFPEPFPAPSEEECRSRCLSMCSCLAYAYDSNIQCVIWRKELIDTQHFWTKGYIDQRKFGALQKDLYIRVASSDLDNHHRIKLIIIVPIVAGFVCISITTIFVVWCWMAKKKGVLKGRKDQKTSEVKPSLSTDSTPIELRDESEKVNIEELPLFTFKTLANATNHFHDDNMLGKGGFGPVYLGKMENGREIAVKRLSAVSAQGVNEFMNEVIVISKLQHRNLVRLIGCCVEREEKMLIYEYMPNRSLDVCLFAPGHPSQKILDWKKRFSIIEGIGRGLLYLHKHSRLRIIHRDLKPSNVLLDGDWNSKISDFGLARIFGGNEDQANTSRVVGTYGYMAPEYAMEGRFSEKSDVYSFGVLLLEIVSGKKNTHYYNEEWSLSLLGCAWKLWKENNGVAFMDQVIASSNVEEEIERCIHIALLCVQESPIDRPTIQTVLSMLSTENKDLPLPEQPVFAEKWNCSHVESTQRISQIGHSINELTVTVLDGR